MRGDMNGYGRLFGGVMMKWMDECACITARRHAESNVTTAAIERVDFIAPAHENDTVVLVSELISVGKSSMKVAVSAYIEEKNGRRGLIADATFVIVAIDSAEFPVCVPQILEESAERVLR